MGIKMGEPWFKLQDKYRNIIAFSSNFPLYADISNRVKKLMGEFSPIQESYSIDESFLDMTGVRDVWDRAFTLRSEILRQVGIPVSIGIARTKTLAKLSSFIAKKHPRSRGVFSWNRLTEPQKQKMLGMIPVDEVWGVGRRLNKKLGLMGITTARQLRNTDPSQMCSLFGIVMERLVSELQEIPCLELTELRPPRKQILSSRSFGRLVDELDVLENAVAYHASYVSEQLREEHSVANIVQVFLQTDRFKENLPQHCPQICLTFPAPTDSTLMIVRKAVEGLHRIVRDKVPYRKAGVCLHELVSGNEVVPDLFSATETPAVVSVMDEINQRFGEGTLRISRDDRLAQSWKPKKDKISPAYTTDWNEVPLCG